MWRFHNWEHVIKCSADTFFLPLTWMTSSLSGSLLLHSVPGVRGLWKVIRLATQLATLALLGRSWLEMQNRVHPCLTDSESAFWQDHQVLKVKIGYCRSFPCPWENWAQWTDWSHPADVGSFIVCPILSYWRKGEIYPFREVLDSITKQLFKYIQVPSLGSPADEVKGKRTKNGLGSSNNL